MPRKYTHHYDLAPHIPERTELHSMGPITVGIEPRVISDGMNDAYKDVTFVELHTMRELMDKFERGGEKVLTSGVSLHVFGHEEGELVEYLRFDCFSVRPHYHYYSMAPETPPIPHSIDTVVQGDPLPWALGRISTRLPEMLRHAGAHELAGQIAQADIEAAMPGITAAAEDVLAKAPPVEVAS